jgi:hypothetical protein
MQEVKVLQASSQLTWILSAYTGTISKDKKEMSGLMNEGGSNETKATVAWSFSKVD